MRFQPNIPKKPRCMTAAKNEEEIIISFIMKAVRMTYQSIINLKKNRICIRSFYYLPSCLAATFISLPHRLALTHSMCSISIQPEFSWVRAIFIDNIVTYCKPKIISVLYIFAQRTCFRIHQRIQLFPPLATLLLLPCRFTVWLSFTFLSIDAYIILFNILVSHSHSCTYFV